MDSPLPSATSSGVSIVLGLNFLFWRLLPLLACARLAVRLSADSGDPRSADGGAKHQRSRQLSKYQQHCQYSQSTQLDTGSANKTEKPTHVDKTNPWSTDPWNAVISVVVLAMSASAWPAYAASPAYLGLPSLRKSPLNPCAAPAAISLEHKTTCEQSPRATTFKKLRSLTTQMIHTIALLSKLSTESESLNHGEFRRGLCQDDEKGQCVQTGLLLQEVPHSL
ncbi:hypothetical protein DFH08DRAFT_811314 [Mycena albidolilacea]|uniref:Uncharacterized protein n=1 Tax=Mycena albidolilacea TaxID=1033008 RepID=A0AAD7ENE8_9AGAR|nr:hypothetical protein DFH08DRAFT_811314 [Mycena albidolilacea]